MFYTSFSIAFNISMPSSFTSVSTDMVQLSTICTPLIHYECVRVGGNMFIMHAPTKCGEAFILQSNSISNFQSAFCPLQGVSDSNLLIVKVLLNVNIAKQGSIYFDAVVIIVKKNLLSSRLDLAILCFIQEVH